MKKLVFIAGLAFALHGGAAKAEVQDCIEITAVPAVITQQGIHCFKQNLVMNATSGNAIEVQVNNVTIDMNGFKLGGLGAGSGTAARGIYALNRTNITIRNGTIRGYRFNIFLEDGGQSSGHLIEDMRIETGRQAGIIVQGENTVVRNNIVIDTGNINITGNATGISVTNGDGHTIEGNIISGVTEDNFGYGIDIGSASSVTVLDNDIREVNGGLASYGIRYSGGSRSIFQGNRINNSTTGTTGLAANGGAEACIDNMVTGYTTAYDGCFYDDGNRSY